MAGRLRPPLNSDPPRHNLLRAKNGLDNQDHFRAWRLLPRVLRERFWRWSKIPLSFGTTNGSGLNLEILSHHWLK